MASLLSTGCCQLGYLSQMKEDSARPNIKPNWNEKSGNGFIGVFVLGKGKSIDNGQLGVKVVNFTPSKCRSFWSEYPDSPQVTLQFYRPADHQVLCEVTLPGPMSNSSIDKEDMCGTKTGFSVVGIDGMNTKDEWVSFDLRK
jgi:hypothetical protein